MLIEALLGDQIDLALQAAFEAFDEPHVADHAGGAAQTNEQIDIALRTVLSPGHAAKDGRVTNPELAKDGGCPLFDVFDGHPLIYTSTAGMVSVPSAKQNNYFGSCVASQPPPRARTRPTLATNWRVCEADGGALVLDQRGLGGQHFKIAGDAAFVALVGEIEGVLRGVDGVLLDAGFLFQDAQAGELVFHVVEGLEDGVPVGRGLGLVAVAGLSR